MLIDDILNEIDKGFIQLDETLLACKSSDGGIKYGIITEIKGKKPYRWIELSTSSDSRSSIPEKNLQQFEVLTLLEAAGALNYMVKFLKDLPFQSQ